LDAADFGDVGFEVALDADLEGHGAGGAADAGAVEADADDALGGDVDELEVAAVGLDGGADEVEDAGDAFLEGGRGGRGCGHHCGMVGRRAWGGEEVGR
jgi:hypothetical protein